MRSLAPGDVRAFKLLAATLAGSAAVSALLLGLLLQSSLDDWLPKAAGVWFGGGLAALLLVTRRAQRRPALIGFVVAAGLSAAVLIPLYRDLEIEPMEPYRAGVPSAVRSLIGEANSRRLERHANRAVPILCVLAYLVLPHVAASGMVALSATEVTGSPVQLSERGRSRRRSRWPLFRFALLLSAIGAGAFHMPANVFGLRWGGSKFCRTGRDCETPLCEPYCYGVKPLLEVAFPCPDAYSAGVAPRPVRCECHFSQCKAIPNSSL